MLVVRAGALLALLPLGAAGVHAEPAGRMGPTSRAAVQISVSIAPKLEVSRSAVLAAESGSGKGGTESFCVRSNTGVGSYSVTATDASDRTADGSAGGVPFEVQLAAARPGAMPLMLAPGVPATGLMAASGAGCGSERLVVRPAKATDNPARRDAVLLLIAPD
jgi:hypothetical protein